MKQTITITAVFILAFVLRISLLKVVPPVITPDEASISYNAFSVIKTGKDEHNEGPYPLTFRSFGDYKSPGIHYLLMPFIKYFGLKLEVVRMVAAFNGFFSVIIIYFLAKELFKDRLIAVLASLILAISPWHINASRMVFEPSSALWMSLLSILFILMSRRKKHLIIWGLLFMILGSLTYNIEMLLLPTVIFLSLVVFKQDFIKNHKSMRVIMGGFVVSLVIISSVFPKIFSEKVDQGIFTHQATIQTIKQRVHILVNQGFPLFFSRGLVNKITVMGKHVVKNYLGAFDISFLFFGVGTDAVEDIGHLNFGNLLLVFLPLIIIGLIKAINDGKNADHWLFYCIAVSVLINALSINEIVTHRLFYYHIFLTLLSAKGAAHLIKLAKKNPKIKIFGLVLLGIGMLNLSQFIAYYYFVYPKNPYPNQEVGIDKVIKIVANRVDEVEAVYITENVFQSYIYFAFYLQFDPSDFQQEAGRITVPEDFDQVLLYKKYHFRENPNYVKQCKKYILQPNQKAMLVGHYKEMPNYGMVEQILIDDPNPNSNDPRWEIIIIDGKTLNQDLVKAKISCSMN